MNNYTKGTIRKSQERLDFWSYALGAALGIAFVLWFLSWVIENLKAIL